MENPFARSEMPCSGARRAANEFLGFEDECILSPDRVLAVHYGAYEIESFGRAYGQVHCYENGHLQTDGYLNYDAILSLRDLGSRIYEVRYGEQQTAWDDAYYGKYEWYGKRVNDGMVTLAKWGDCASRQLVLSVADYDDLCARIAQMPAHFGDFDQYRTHVRARARGEHRYFLHRARSSRGSHARDAYGRRILGARDGWHDALLPYDHGGGKVESEYFLLGTPQVWTAQCSKSSLRSMLYRGERGWGEYGKPTWLEISIVFTHYQDGLFKSRCRLYAYQLMTVAKQAQAEATGTMMIPPPDARYGEAVRISWDSEGATISLEPDRFDHEEHTTTFWFRRDVWEWVLQQTPEIEYWYHAIDDEMALQREKKKYE